MDPNLDRSQLLEMPLLFFVEIRWTPALRPGLRLRFRILDCLGPFFRGIFVLGKILIFFFVGIFVGTTVIAITVITTTVIFVSLGMIVEAQLENNARKARTSIHDRGGPMTIRDGVRGDPSTRIVQLWNNGIEQCLMNNKVHWFVRIGSTESSIGGHDINKNIEKPKILHVIKN